MASPDLTATAACALAPSVPAHPAFAPYAAWLAALPGRTAPGAAVDTLNGWAAAARLSLPDGRRLRFVPAERHRASALAYERRIAEAGEISVRPGDLHDVCNALAWLAFPRTKAALNRTHCGSASSGHPGRRGAARDAATLLDEFGVLVSAPRADLVALWRRHAWRELFHDRRREVEDAMSIAVIGHGLLAALARPFPALTAKALVLEEGSRRQSDRSEAARTSVDAMAAAWLDAAGEALSPARLLPLPVAAWPGWDARGPERFADATVFRPSRAK